MSYSDPLDTMPSKEDLQAEILKAVKKYGEGHFYSDDNTQSLRIHKVDVFYRVYYSYNFLDYRYTFHQDEVEPLESEATNV